jgi:PAS domain S-box-containing protein
VGFWSPGPRTGGPSWGAPFRQRLLRALLALALLLCGACAGIFLWQRLPSLPVADRSIAGQLAFLGSVLSAGAAVALDLLLRRRSRRGATRAGVGPPPDALRDFVGSDETAGERLEATLEALPDLLFDVDHEGRIRDFRAPRPELLYRPAAEFLGLRMQDVLPVQASRVIVAALEKAAVSGHHSGSVYTLDLADGRHWFELSVAAKGGEQGFVLLARDVTERAQDAEELRQESDLVTRLLETSPAGIVKMDREGRITFANAQAEAVLGLGRSDIDGRRYDAPEWRITDHAGKAFPAEQLPLARVAASREQVRGVQYAIAWPDGRRVLLSVNAAPLFDSDGAFDGIVATVENVTERVRVEQALRESELHYRSLLAILPDAVMVHEQGRFTYLNPAALALFGARLPEALLGTPIIDRVSPESREVVRQRIARIADTGRGVGFVEEQFVRLDGSTVGVEVTAVPFVHEGRTAVQVLARDVSERKRAERARVESAERLRATFDEAGIGMAELAPDGRLLRVNSRLAELLGAPAELLVGGSLLQHVDSDRAHLVALREELLEGARRSIEADARLRRSDGSQAFVHCTESAVRDAEGLVRYSIVVVEDVTARRQAESEQQRLELALRHAASEWARTFDALNSAVLLVGADGRVMRLNRATWELAGRPLADCLGRPLAKLGAGAPWSTALPLPVLALRDGTASAEAHEGTHWWEVVATRVAEGGPVVLVIRDVSQVRDLERSVGQAEQMAALGAVTAGVAHEVRNPLFAISASMDALRVMLAEKPEVHKLLDVAGGEVRRLSELLEDLLEYGKPSAPAAQESELRSVLAAAVAARQSQAVSARVRIVLGEGAAPLPVRVDAGRIRRVFENAIDNAVQHSRAGGEVRLEAERIEEPGGRWARCRVLDEGQGIASYDLPHLFEPFFTRRRGGTGLGLSIAEKIVREHGGRISIGNRPAAGVELVVDLPLLSAETANGVSGEPR